MQEQTREPSHSVRVKSDAVYAALAAGAGGAILGLLLGPVFPTRVTGLRT